MCALQDVAVSAAVSARHGHANLFFWQSLAGDGRAYLQCSCSVTPWAGTTGKSINFKAGPKGWRSSPGQSLPASLSGRAFPKVTSCTISELALSPGSQTLRRRGAGMEWAQVPSSAFCPYWSSLPTSPAIPWLNAPLFSFFPQSRLTQAREEVHSNADCLCPALVPSLSLMYTSPEQKKPSAMSTYASPHRVLHGFPHPVLMTLCLLHSPIQIIVVVIIPGPFWYPV